MSDPQAASTKAADPLEQWRELRDAYMDIWAKASGEAVNSEAYAQATGTMLEAFLSTSSPFRDAQKKVMVSALEQANMPSRDDYLRLADRMANLEFLLDDMDARLRQVYHMLARSEKPAATVSDRPAPKAVPAPNPAFEAELFAASQPTAVTAAAPKEAPRKAAARKTPAKISKKGSKRS
jgi:hypothetical protein